MRKTYSKPETTSLDIEMMPLLAGTIHEEITDKPEPGDGGGSGSGGGGEYGGEVGAPLWGGVFDYDDTEDSY